MLSVRLRMTFYKFSNSGYCNLFFIPQQFRDKIFKESGGGLSVRLEYDVSTVSFKSLTLKVFTKNQRLMTEMK
jgi:hypothetical protein